VVAVWLLRRHRGAPQDALEPLTVLGVLVAAQGLVGAVQYELKLPTDMVWVHVTLATLSWVVVLWAVALEGRLAPRRAPAPAGERRITARELEAVGPTTH
jgi:cytochrome c oxidase assembly protein subunit 15